ncbi:alpha/beta fold hydrolase [Glutamicibacter sp. 363]|uniref:alpha/beta fold hydrolase n=1 Tax=unclassified Glutamicibacter TaxID=2627139 RepID=UPI004034B73D
MESSADGRLCVRHGYFGQVPESLRTRLSVRVAGEGPDVVLIHGLGASSRYFTPLATELARDHRVIVPELPGHGKNMDDGRPVSVARFAHEVSLALRTLNVKNAVILGHSMGAQVSIEIARTHPELLEHLIIAAPSVNDREATLFRQARRLIQDFPHEWNAVKAILLVDYLRCGIPWWAKSCTEMLDYSTIDLLGTVPFPVDVVCGTQDSLSPPEFGLRLTAKAPQAKLTVFQNAAHGFNYSHFEELAELVRTANSATISASKQ